MYLNLFRYIVLIALLMAFPARAVVFGDIEILSNYNEQLKAYIPIVEHDDIDVIALDVSVAKVEEYGNSDIELNYLVYSIQFRVIKDDHGSYFIELTTAELLLTPFLEVLVNFNWGDGTLIRGYSLILEFPLLDGDAVNSKSGGSIFTPYGSISSVGKENKRVIDISRIKKISRSNTTTPPPDNKPTPSSLGTTKIVPTESEKISSVEAVTQAPPQPPPPPKPITKVQPPPSPVKVAPIAKTPPVAKKPTPEVASYPVQRGDTLWNIALLYKAELGSINQAMIAMYDKNPSAFYKNNINYLNAGSTLVIPSEQDIIAITKLNADARVQGDYDEFHSLSSRISQQKKTGTSSNSNFIVLAEDVSDAGGESTTSSISKDIVGSAKLQGSAKNKEELIALRRTAKQKQQELVVLDKQFEKSKSILTISSNQIATLQNKLSTLKGEPEKLETEQTIATAQPLPPKPDTSDLPFLESVEVEVTYVYQQVLAGNYEVLIQSPTTLTVILLLMVIIILIFQLISFIIYRNKSEQFFADSDSFGENIDASKKSSFLSSLFAPLMGSKSKSVEEILAEAKEESQYLEKQTPASESAPIVEEIKATQLPQSSEGDGDNAELAIREQFLGEVSTYLGYGLFDQAELVLNEAIDTDPDNTSTYLGRLLDTFYASKNNDKFLETAKKIKDMDDEVIWDRAVTLGKNLTPNDPLFINEQSSSILRTSEFKVEKPVEADVDLSDAGAEEDLITDIDVGNTPSADSEDVLDLVADSEKLGTEESSNSEPVLDFDGGGQLEISSAKSDVSQENLNDDVKTVLADGPSLKPSSDLISMNASSDSVETPLDGSQPLMDSAETSLDDPQPKEEIPEILLNFDEGETSSASKQSALDSDEINLDEAETALGGNLEKTQSVEELSDVLDEVMDDSPDNESDSAEESQELSAVPMFEGAHDTNEGTALDSTQIADANDEDQNGSIQDFEQEMSSADISAIQDLKNEMSEEMSLDIDETSIQDNLSSSNKEIAIDDFEKEIVKFESREATKE